MSISSPLDSVKDISVRVTIKVNNKAIKGTYGIKSVQVVHAVNKISYAEVVLLGDNITESQSIPMTDSDDFNPGNTISIEAGYGGGETNIFNGVIVSHGVVIDAASGYSVKLVCKHSAVTMTYNRNEAEFFTKSDSDIIKAITENYGLNTKIDKVDSKQEAVFQRMSTDWDFVLARCDFNGFIICMDGDKITIGKPQLSSGPVLRIAVGDSLISFEGELSAENQPPNMTVSAWDIKEQALIVVSATEPSVNTQGNITAKELSGKLNQQPLKLITAAPLLQENLKIWVDAELLRKRLAAFKGKVKFIGNASVKTGSIIELDGVGKKLEGCAFVSSVIHVIEEGLWYTTVKFGLEDIPVHSRADFSYSPAVGQMPAVHGLQIATVKKISADPNSQYRIQVNIASNSKTQDGIWARMANFYATSGAGAFFLPEIGDEVIVGFLGGDLSHPVILGSFYSDANKPPVTASDENNYIKSITTKSKMVLSFDDQNKIIKITTSGNNSITISDKDKAITIADQNSNSIKLSSDGIVLNSGKDIKLTASGGITLSATQKINIAAQQDVAVSGMNVNNTAQVGFTGKGSATAELSASGQTTIKGAMVMIN